MSERIMMAQWRCRQQRKNNYVPHYPQPSKYTARETLNKYVVIAIFIYHLVLVSKKI